MENQNQLLVETILKYKEVPINKFGQGKGITSYFLEYAAEKYNLTLKKSLNNKISKLYFKNQEIAMLSGLRPSSTSDTAYKLCKDKFKLENHLKNMKLSTLESKHFYQEEYKQALNYIENSQHQNFAVKPLNMAGGKGIQLEVTKEIFKEAWDKCIVEQEQANITKPSCLIQPFINGFDVRVSIIEGKYIGALLRVPAHVVGNGEHSIRELIEEKNKIRSSISYFKNKLIPIDFNLEKFIKNSDLSLDSVPEKDDVIMLTKMSNLTFGGESIDITNILSDKIKNLAINAAASIPGLYSTGIDIMTHDFKDGIGYIIEMNTSANLTMHHLPLKGEKRFPYFTYVRTSLIKHKVLNNIRLTIKEEESWSEVQKFLFLKDKYANVYFNRLKL